MLRRALFIFGTRPEAIKLAPVIRQAKTFALDPVLCVTAQHRELLDQPLRLFGLTPDYDLNLMRPAQSLDALTAAALTGASEVIRQARPDWVIVQGDTATTLAGALAGFYARVPVVHIEAGLRTVDPSTPFPEEMNRRLTTRLASLHFAPTERARAALLSEGVAPERIQVTGNTAIDALRWICEQLDQGAVGQGPPPETGKRYRIVVTAHRRESFGAGMRAIAAALRTLAQRADLSVVVVAHPNPEAGGVLRRELAGCDVTFLDALDPASFVALIRDCALVLTDSGGLQEEAPALGKPVLVLREETERPEAVECGAAELVGTDTTRIVAAVTTLLADPQLYARRAVPRFPFGDGHAAERILRTLAAS